MPTTLYVRAIRHHLTYLILMFVFIIFAAGCSSTNEIESAAVFMPEGSLGTSAGELYMPIMASNANASTDADWPQYQHDAARTGYNPAEVSGHQFNEVWSKRFVNDAISPTAQPIIKNSLVFIGTEKGKLYAFQLATGAELWQKQLDGAIIHTPATNDNAIFVGTLSGYVYALDINTGGQLWRFTSDASFGSAVLLVEEQGAIYMADRRGKVYAIDAGNGLELWHRDLCYSILQSPAFGDGRVYIGVENMRLYALDASTGQVLWRTAKLFGRSFHDYAPVFADGKVIVNTMPDVYTYSTNDLNLLREANVDISNSGNLSEAQNATIQWLQQNPEAQTFYIFDAATGHAPYIPGVLYVVANSGAQPPPVYANGELFTAFHVTSPRWLRKYWTSQDHGGLGKLNLGTGRIIERLSKTPGEFTSDETNNYSGAGDILIGARCQTRPRCITLDDTSNSCKVVTQTLYPFTDDLCLPGSPPIYAQGYLAYHAYDTLIVYQAEQ